MSPKAALAFVKAQGIVLESAHGPVPNLAERVAGGRIRGSWWGHPKGREIFRLTRAVRDSQAILVCRLVQGKVTYVHRRLWPALVRLARRIGATRLAAIREIHLASGKHIVRVTPFPRWVPAGVRRAARRLSDARAAAALGGRFLRPRAARR